MTIASQISQFHGQARNGLLSPLGLVGMFCIIVAAFFNFNDVSAPRAAGYTVATQSGSAIVRNAPPVSISWAHNRNERHFSIRNKSTGKVLLENGSAVVPGLFQMLFAKVVAANVLSGNTTVPTPGYYLFLFRYALF